MEEVKLGPKAQNFQLLPARLAETPDYISLTGASKLMKLV
jgi:hypothetical protein